MALKSQTNRKSAKKLEDFKSKASKIDGISNVTTKTDFDNYVFIIKLNYANLKALNAVVNTINNQRDQIHFSGSGKNFERIASYPIPEKSRKRPEEKERP
ncbi:hypothetical protein [Flavobacterium sp. CGRL2]